ncbi:hypothetical protein F3Y22_tig00110220pilonHSYRG00020 [Hibiscus syriacus]|uniref:Fatty acyl-CoA reductase n=1 Tax=Hibiscus syriacus TaxID=106335 RepID=A0A6A3B7N0_HIBSY|nr:hypothetical protein F3Y22_tig00110220pilonHSYRG00020 [Hibiscus syriacus]
MDVKLKERKHNRSSLRVGFIHPNLKKDGIGIENFLKGKVILITGATVFLAKVLIEKILRSVPDVSKIYLIIRGKDMEDARQRLKYIVDIELFHCLKQKHGEHYEAFMWSKLVTVIGDVAHPTLGIPEDLAVEIAKHVQIIVKVAADTAFDQSKMILRYDVALQVNAMGPCNLLNFAIKCKILSSSCIHHQALLKDIQEKEDLWRKRDVLVRKIAWETVCVLSETTVLENEMKLASDYKKLLKPNDVLLIYESQNISALIVRPSGILSTYKKPFPGWIEGIKYLLLDPVIVYYGKGKLTGFPLNPNCSFDIVNSRRHSCEYNVGNNGKACFNVQDSRPEFLPPLFFFFPIVLEDLFNLIYQHFKSRPLIDSIGRSIRISEMKVFNSLQNFSNHLWRSSEAAATATLPSQFSTTKLIEAIKFKEHAEYLATIYLPQAFHTYWFDDSKTRGLIESMSAEEKMKFGCDVKRIDLKDYIVNVHIPGLRRHVLKEKSLSKI